MFPDVLKVQGGTDRLRAPVRPAQTVFAHFKHIRGVPSSEGGVSLFRLRVLDNLIDRLLVEGGRAPSGLDGAGLTAGAVDSMTEGMQRELRERVLSPPAPLGGGFSAFGTGFSGRGTLIDLVA